MTNPYKHALLETNFHFEGIPLCIKQFAQFAHGREHHLSDAWAAMCRCGARHHRPEQLWVVYGSPSSGVVKCPIVGIVAI